MKRESDNIKGDRSRKIYLDRFQRVFGKLALTVLIAYTLERTYGTFANYFHYPTYFETRYVSQFYAQMPAFTMCSLLGYKSHVLMVRIQKLEPREH